jgi:3',5'-cyclic AMP phosphodiesterase CpdA
MCLRCPQFPRRFTHRLICVALALAAVIALVGSLSARALAAPLSPNEKGPNEKGPIQKGPYLQDLSPTGVLVRVEVSPPSPARLEIVEKGGAEKKTDAGKPLVFEHKDAAPFHSIRASGLRPKTNYEYSIHVAGVVQRGTFTTAPNVDSTDSFSFLVYGDNRTDEVGHAAVVRAMSRAGGDFLVHTGDFVQDGANAADWQSFFDIETPLLRDRCVFACVGNHEIIDGMGAAYLRYFGPVIDATEGDTDKPKLYGSFRWGNARFFLLNAMDAWNSGPERAWLEGELARADDEAGLVWRIAVLHHGPWSAGPHGGNPRIAQALVPALLSKHKIDLILAGHDHIYERGFADGLRYVVSGGGGAPLYRVEAPLPSTRKVESARHYVLATVTPTGIDLAATRDDGTLLEKCGFTKASLSWDCDPRPTVSIAQPASAATPAPSPSRCACRAAGLSVAAAEPRDLAPAASLVALGAAAIAIVARRRAR